MTMQLVNISFTKVKFRFALLALKILIFKTRYILPPPSDLEVHLRLLGIHGPLQLHHPHLALRHRGDAEVPRLLFHLLGFGPLPRGKRPESSGQHLRPQRGAGAGMDKKYRHAHTRMTKE